MGQGILISGDLGGGGGFISAMLRTRSINSLSLRSGFWQAHSKLSAGERYYAEK
jgi:hypothetical protein